MYFTITQTCWKYSMFHSATIPFTSPPSTSNSTSSSLLWLTSRSSSHLNSCHCCHLPRPQIDLVLRAWLASSLFRTHACSSCLFSQVMFSSFIKLIISFSDPSGFLKHCINKSSLLCEFSNGSLNGQLFFQTFPHMHCTYNYSLLYECANVLLKWNDLFNFLLHTLNDWVMSTAFQVFLTHSVNLGFVIGFILPLLMCSLGSLAIHASYFARWIVLNGLF